MISVRDHCLDVAVKHADHDMPARRAAWIVAALGIDAIAAANDRVPRRLIAAEQNICNVCRVRLVVSVVWHFDLFQLETQQGAAAYSTSFRGRAPALAKRQL